MGILCWTLAFLGNRKGSALVNFALISPVLMMSVGAGIDISRTETARSEVQAGLDAAVLAAFNKDTTPNATISAKYFAARKYSDNLSIDAPKFTTGTGTIVGTVSFKYKPLFLSLASISDINMSVTAKATASRDIGISSVTATIVSAKGAYDKQIYFFTKDRTGAVTSETLLLDYDYVAPNKYFTPPVGNSKTASITSYDSYGYYMVVYQDLSYTGKRINPVRFYSTDLSAASYRKSSGTCSTGSGQTDSWEDGGSSDFTDFVMKVSCTLAANGPLKVQLVN